MPRDTQAPPAFRGFPICSVKPPAKTLAFKTFTFESFTFKTFALTPALDAFNPINEQSFGKARLGPFFDSRQRQHRIHVGLCPWRHVDRIGTEAIHHWRKHGVGGAEASKQERTELAIALPAFEPDLLDPRNVGARILRQ